MSRLRHRLAFLGLGLVPACGSPPSQPEDNNPPPPDPVVAHIEGATLVGIPVGDDPSGTTTFSGASSTGPVVRYEWFELNASEPFAEGVTAERTVSNFGQFRTRLRVEGAEGQSDEDTLATLVDVDLKRGDPVVGFTTSNRYGTDGTVIAYMLATGTKVSFGLRLPLTQFGGASWNPDHTRLVISYDYDIWVANRDGTQLERIIDTEWIAWQPDWSPTGEWITYNDDSHDGLGPPDLLYVARPDGSDVTLVGGDPTDWNFSVSHPSWDPTGTQIAASAHRWEVEPGVTKGRIVIFGDLWGTATRRAFHTEAQIEAAFGPPTEYDVDEGGNGISWSPDGEWIAYIAVATPPDFANEFKLVVARADGSDDIRILVSSLETAGLVVRPTWSPDGQTVFFMRWSGSESHIVSIPVTGGSETNLSAKTNADASDLFPFF
jgi:WD40-like Beta Propeller Repeat